jgi:hypothetical protein
MMHAIYRYFCSFAQSFLCVAFSAVCVLWAHFYLGLGLIYLNLSIQLASLRTNKQFISDHDYSSYVSTFLFRRIEGKSH